MGRSHVAGLDHAWYIVAFASSIMHESSPSASRRRIRRADLLLGIGAALGVTLAAVGLGGFAPRAGTALPADAVARVNGETIAQADYERMLAAVAADRRNEIDAAERQRILDRLIDEELLVQRSLELGLGQRDRKIRADLTAAVIESVVSESQDLRPTEEELRRFYEERRQLFARPGNIHVRQIFFRTAAMDGASAQGRAREATRRVRAGEDFAAVRNALGDAEISPLPDGLLPPAKLREYVGLTALRAALALEPGEVSDPIRSGVGYHVLQLIEHQPASIPPLAEIKTHVQADLQRQRAEEALRSYLDDLRARAEIELAPNLP